MSCSHCGDTGTLDCPKCHSEGQIEVQGYGGSASSLKDCPNCGGAGLVMCPNGCDC
jgi:hypothetical protein